MYAGQIGPPDLRSLLAIALLAGLVQSACGRLGPGATQNVAETSQPPLAAADSFTSNPTLILDADNDRPAPLVGVWKVATGGRSCGLTLVVDENEISGYSTGCSKIAETRPIAIGLVSGSSFMFQTGRGGDGWIWSGRYNSADRALEGRREHVITGKLESFVARR